MYLMKTCTHYNVRYCCTQAEQEWSSIEDKQRYLRLQHLLEKSYIYCQFLLERMEKQKKDAQKQQERLAKKLEKKKKDEYKTTEQVQDNLLAAACSVKIEATSIKTVSINIM